MDETSDTLVLPFPPVSPISPRFPLFHAVLPVSPPFRHLAVLWYGHYVALVHFFGKQMFIKQTFF